MGMTIDDIKHCLRVMVDCEVCEECNLYGTTGTDHCEHDCVTEALDIIEKYQQMKADYNERLKTGIRDMLYGIQFDAEKIENIYKNDEKDRLQYLQYKAFKKGFSRYSDLIQEKIDELRGGSA